MAPGAHYGSGDSYHARYDLWVYIHVAHRPTAGINSHTHHRIRPVGRRSGRGRRRHQAWPCGRFPPSDSGMAGADEISHSDVLRNIDQYYCLSAVPYAPRQYWGVPAQSSHRYDASLVSALIVAMTFIPVLGYYIQRRPAKREPTLEEKRQRGFYGFYNRLVGWAIQHRWSVLGASSLFLLLGGFTGYQFKSQFFPEDV